MFTTRFLQAHDRKPVTTTETFRSGLFTRRAAMRCHADEPNSSVTVSAMTAALVSVADMRTPRPEVPSTSDLITADVEPTAETPEQEAIAPATKVKKAGRKRKNEVPGAPRRKRALRKMEQPRT